MQIFIDIIADSLIDTLKIFPFLFITYLAMEYIEHKTGERTKEIIAGSGKVGPLLGALLGAFPQCGFSAAASGLYAGRVITVGTLMAVYLSTSDEMLPIFLSEKVPVSVIFKVLGLKVIVGIIAGFLLDFTVKKFYKSAHNHHEHGIGHLCEHDHCHCKEDSIFKSALIHSLKITLFIFLVNVVLGVIIEFVGQDTLSSILTNKPVLGPAISGIIGLVPNCAASVIITQLYLEGALSFGSMMSGLLVGAGVGLLVLFRSNDSLKKNFQILGILYGFGVVSGIIIELIGITV